MTNGTGYHADTIADDDPSFTGTSDIGARAKHASTQFGST
jgi:hypothetical protein